MLTKLELLKKCLSLQSESGKEKEQINPDIHLILKQLQSLYSFKLEIEEQDNGNIYITKGKKEFYPCVVAHSDDVAKYNPDKTLIALDGCDWIRACDKITGKSHDTGGDDKCGLWAIFQFLIDLPAIKAVIFVSEENGCNGSKAANLDFFKDCMFVAQFDRRHVENDFITYTNGVNVCSDEFKKFIAPYLEKYGYKTASGSITDVGALRIKGLEISSFNISAGYFSAHTSDSYVVPSKLFKSYDLVLELFTNFEGQSVFAKEVQQTIEMPTVNGMVKDISKFFTKKFIKEHKHNKGVSSTVNNVITWMTQKLFDIDEKYENIYPDYQCMIDILWDYTTVMEEEETIEKIKEFNSTNSKDKYICRKQFCTESRSIDYFAVGGPEEICNKCSKVFPVYEDNRYNGYTDYRKWENL